MRRDMAALYHAALQSDKGTMEWVSLLLNTPGARRLLWAGVRFSSDDPTEVADEQVSRCLISRSVEAGLSHQKQPRSQVKPPSLTFAH